MDTVIKPDIAPVEKLKAELALIEEKVVTGYSLADAIREGAGVSGQKIGGWIEDGESCALGAAWIAAKARGYVD